MQVPWIVVVVAAGLLSGHVLMRRVSVLPHSGAGGVVAVGDPPGGNAGVRCSIVIPARDEAETLPDLLRSLVDQTSGDGSDVEVIVVDDESTDDTAAVAAAYGAVVIVPGTPPAGWVGKTWACWQGARVARGDRLVFLDADVRLQPGSLADLLRTHQDLTPTGLLSVQPFHRTEHAYEQFSAYPNVVAAMGSGAFTGRPPKGPPVAFGPCLVTTTEAYRSVGGHHSVAAEVVEDLHLARAYAADGRPVRCLAGGDSIWFRMYPRDIRQLIQGWTKNLAEGAHLAPPAPTLGAVLWVLATAFVAGGALWGAGHGEVTAWAVAAWPVVALQLRSILRRLGRFQPWAWAFFPATLAGFFGVFFGSVVRRVLLHRVAWRGRSIPVGRA